MATDMQPARPDGPGPESEERWQRAWSHREDLLKVARRRSVSAEDAEDAVHEAMLRAAEHPDLDDERLGAWLTTVTMRLCVDRHRQVHREAQVRSSPRLHHPGPVPVEEAVCDRAEANWLAVRSSELPARQAEALWLKSEDLDVGQVATKMGLSYRTVESLLARARRTLRNSLAATLGLVLWLCGRGRPGSGGNAQAVALASTAVTLAVAGLVLPYVHDGDTPRPSPVPPAVTEAAGSGAPEPGRSGAPAAPSPAPTQGAPDGARPAGERGLPLPALPGVPLPALPLSTPPVSGLPVPGAAEDLVSSLPSVPASVPTVAPSVPTEPSSVPAVPAPSTSVPSAPVPPAVPAQP
ncbi:sigma-70 family RNA polymerase sigma factor [Streptomyces sp. Tu 2975]|uniref:sigma-70 family RNA polymerase sigma factor n=1 Tax=Streptomyces sp. Tu 2975 TaxID=2676871 RepID=UPI00135BBFC6|nr:sigma-70 family RNA polymerase sigma factor [Streptomyces sp. Tu 2975]QIP83920.1 sigma-70 family RNA polymerase sigma factor [Streptomyces sp. Tu 2975]